MSRSVWQKLGHIGYALQLIWRYLDNAWNYLYFVSNACRLELLIVQNIILIECRRMINGMDMGQISCDNIAWFLFIFSVHA